MEVRTATVADALSIARVHTRSWQVGYAGHLPQAVLDGLSVERREQRWAERLAAAEDGVIVAEVDGEVGGFAAVGPSRDEGAALSTGELRALYVDPGRWGLGLGRRLLADADRVLLERGFAAANLWVLRSNSRARGLYERAGWTLTTGTKVEQMEGTVVEEVQYRRALLS